MALRTPVSAGTITGRFGPATQTASKRSAGHSRRATIALWSTQGVLAAVFLMAGVTKLVMTSHDLASQSDLPVLFLRFIGVCETAGALGLILPGVFGIKRGLTPLAAAGLVVIMIGATAITAGAGDVVPALFPFIVGVLAATVAYFRWQRLPGSVSATTLEPAA